LPENYKPSGLQLKKSKTQELGKIEKNLKDLDIITANDADAEEFEEEKEEKKIKKKTEGIEKDPLIEAFKKRKMEQNTIIASELQSSLITFKDNEYDLIETVNQLLSRYSLIKHNELEFGDKVGEGGYGQVVKGVWLSKEVAIKSFDRKRITNKRTIDGDFLREVEMLQKLRHPNIVLFMGVSITPECKGLIVTEFMKGGSLFDHIHKKETKFTDE
jgi:hypothetical protein